ncbi:uncharacterized protein LOC114711720 [Neltuma alba]|uniref:uncharacterized protein LOC114711720 n=1 Tax=Neltuma alba TaxID=207710 RepID=UPI0010A3B3EB|nr:uncharacterized protein LOC114711720 [Prosopis alba]XP_028751980.1 uncharacterized protein LOC114711720 [Prosopis alba]XP_028751981.1 uncharacterized protein LOC114711720 [Prosopis alba]XP_028751983.1 uncharacterized protein LOC114711720 [Prosopis alba]XP_028751984.1 uncharacterized protein LOC114711720 [Prosopis alba]XP_028751985.1 uncharacterized protein LOC114711720 [Prosopis alba]XP_028751986.1 uncharacterized protein LOC114711720 [Prosopis alba]
MVLISGNNKSILQHPNDARSKASGVTVFHNPHHQQGSKNIETRPSHNVVSSNLTKGMTALDEFKYGFPSEGLSTTSNKWWGSSGPDDSVGKKADGPDVGKHGKDRIEGTEKEEADTEMSEAGKETMKTPEGAALLADIRKRAVQEGRETLKLGVFRGCGVKKIGKREKIMLLQIFSSSLPSSWIHDSS